MTRKNLNKLLMVLMFMGVLLSFTAATPEDALAAYDPYVGEIQLYAFNYTPTGWLFCQGQSLNTSQYQVLFALLGNTYGGNSTTFNLPDLRGAEPRPGVQYAIAVNGLFPVRP